MRRGFTLVEILITLGVLGSIAAMTIPTLAYTYRGKVLEQEYKATYSDLKEVSSKINTENGDIGEFADKMMVDSEDAEPWAQAFMGYLLSSSNVKSQADTINTLKNIYKNSNRPIGPKNFSNDDIAEICEDSSVWLDGKGRIFTFNKGNRVICIDINGTNSPNKVNVDIFAFKVFTAAENAHLTEGANADVNDYSGTIIPCNLAKVQTGVVWSNTGCPFFDPMQDTVPKNGNVFEKSSHGKTLGASNNYWKDYIDYR